MAEENEKKPEFVVHKKQPDNTQVNSASNTAKKKIVVVKKKNPSVSDAPQKTEPQKKDGVRVVVKRPAAQSSVEAQDKAENSEKASDKNEKAAASASKTEVRPQKRTFELNTARPNVKAGNLSDYARRDRNGGYGRNGYGNGGQNRSSGRDGSAG